MRRVIGIDVHRTFGEVVFWENGRLRHAGRIDMTRTALEGFGKILLAGDEVVIEATGNSMAVSRVLTPFVARVIIANPLQVKAIAQAHVKTDKIDAGTLASLQAAGYLPQIWTPDPETERKRRLVTRRYQVVRRTRLKNEVHSILHAHLIPKCPHADLFNARGRAWVAAQQLPDDERAAIDQHVRELDRLAEDLALLDREIARDAIEDSAANRLMTITGVNLAVAAGIVAAIGDISRFSSPQKLVSYFELTPRVRQSGLGAAHHGRISKIGRSHARAMLVAAAWAAAKATGPLHAFFVRIRARRGHQIAAVAVARNLTVLCWHLLTKGEDYLWARPALVANKTRAMQLQAGHPQQKGNRRGPAYAYNMKALRDCEMLIAAQAEQSTNDSCRNGSRGTQKPARGRLSSAGQNRQSGDACSRRVTLRHEVARAQQP
ncbi:IS110 family transposase [Bradyrhizobium sp. USDA 3458]|uniref:IS110 family transposase n=1 Tax=Bradyrhizobium sp. USDA 3458 TaxID=2591461 RepID=UPI001FF06631|nr:IS110 family transposase [Bradyrhizobium sp. USDA 3458]